MPEQEFNTWIRPLQAIESADELRLLAPNHFVVNWVRNHGLPRLRDYSANSPGKARCRNG